MLRASLRTAWRRTLLSLSTLLLFSSCSDPEAAPSGQALYFRHCASCHGAAGDGQGPLAASLLRPPSDLRTIAKRSGGRFDEAEVMAVIDGRRTVAEHGSREMPVWGTAFEGEERPKGHPGYTSLLHSRALTDYLRSIQQN